MMEEKKEKVKKPKSKARKIIEWVLTGIFVIIFGVLAIGFLDGMVNKNKHYGQQIRFGYASFVVQTDSMEPKYNVKSAIITYLDDCEKIYQRYQKGENVDLTFFDAYARDSEYTSLQKPENAQYITRTENTGWPMTHRLIEMHVDETAKKGEGRYIFFTAGINEESEYLGASKGHPVKITQYQVFTEKELLGRVVLNSAFLGGVFGFIGSVWGLLVLLLIPAFYLIITSVIDIFKAYKEPEEVTEGAKPSSGGTKELSEEDKKRLKEELLQEMLNKKKGE